jgi:hypothetical protein
VLQNRGGADTAQLSRILQDILADARKRPEIGFVYSGFDPRIPQIEFQVDRDKVKSLGIPLNDVFFALQTFLGSYYINDFNLYGRTYRVQAQAEGSQRSQPDGVNRFYVRSDGGTMVPLSTLVSSRPLNGPQYFERYNVYSAATINGTNAPGYSSGQAIAAMEEIARALPPGFAYEWSEATYQEKKTGGQTGYIFAVSLLFVVLVLAALYESWAMPVAILLVIPVRRAWSLSGPSVAQSGQQRLYANRTHHAGRARGEECDPDRGVREAPARARGNDRTGGAERREAQASPDSHDVVRIHPGKRPPRHRARGRSRRAAGARDGRRIRHARRHAGRRVLHSGFLRDPAEDRRTAVAIPAPSRRILEEAAGATRASPRGR